MATPVLTASLNKTTYAPGEQIVLTVTYSDPDTATSTTTVTGTDQDGNAATVTVQVNVVDPVTITVTEAGRVWTQQSDNGSVAVYVATA